jgi:hypothetical protein
VDRGQIHYGHSASDHRDHPGADPVALCAEAVWTLELGLMSENLPTVDSVAAKAGVDPEVVRAVYEAIAAETTVAGSEATGTGSSHKVEIPVGKVVPSATVT